MPTPRKYATNAERQAAYRARCATAPPPGPLTPAKTGTRRWTMLVRHAHAMLQTVSEEMADYAHARTDAWHDSERGDAFQERLAVIEEVMSLLQDLSEP